jgi:hypothetical protein
MSGPEIGAASPDCLFFTCVNGFANFHLSFSFATQQGDPCAVLNAMWC